MKEGSQGDEEDDGDVEGGGLSDWGGRRGLEKKTKKGRGIIEKEKACAQRWRERVEKALLWFGVRESDRRRRRLSESASE